MLIRDSLQEWEKHCTFARNYRWVSASWLQTGNIFKGGLTGDSGRSAQLFLLSTININKTWKFKQISDFQHGKSYVCVT
jgi:hypothetical protein